MVGAREHEWAADLTSPAMIAGGRSWRVVSSGDCIDRVVDRVARSLAAMLLLAEIFLIGSSVVARYVFRRPLIWSTNWRHAVHLADHAGRGDRPAPRQHLRLLCCSRESRRRCGAGWMPRGAPVRPFSLALIVFGLQYARVEAVVTSARSLLGLACGGDAGGRCADAACRRARLLSGNPVRPLS